MYVNNLVALKLSVNSLCSTKLMDCFDFFKINKAVSVTMVAKFEIDFNERIFESNPTHDLISNFFIDVLKKG